MTRDEAIERACAIVDNAWERIDPEAKTASDCFHKHPDGISYQNDGRGFRFLEFLLARVTPKMIAEFEAEERHARCK